MFVKKLSLFFSFFYENRFYINLNKFLYKNSGYIGVISYPFLMFIFCLLMYCYCFDKFFGFDRVVKFQGNIDDVSAGDLFLFQEHYYFCLGESVSFVEQYFYIETVFGKEIDVLFKSFFSGEYLSLLHWMVYYNYTTYRSVMKYFITSDINKLLEREIPGKIRQSKKNKIISLDFLLSEDEKGTTLEVADLNYKLLSKGGQILFIFPDIWTLKNMVDEKILENKKSVVLYSGNTLKQKDLAWRNIKKGKVNYIFSTPGEVFHDYCKLEKIYYIFPDKWYYTNQQDPRFKMDDVARVLGNIYDIDLSIYSK